MAIDQDYGKTKHFSKGFYIFPTIYNTEEWE